MLFFTNNYFLDDIPSFIKKDFLLIYNKTFEMLKLNQEKEISIVFIDDNDSQKINHNYRNKDYPTDVISFSFNEGKNEIKIIDGIICLGEIFINIDKAKHQAKTYNHTEKREFAFLFLHGLLHILGYNHILKDERKEMFALQKEILQKCKINR